MEDVKLKPSDIAVLQDLVDGKAPKESLERTPKGVRNKLFRLRRLLGCRTNEQLAAKAVANGWAKVR